MTKTERHSGLPSSVDELRRELLSAREANVGLSREKSEALAQQAAVSEILNAMSRSPYALDQLLQAAIDHGTKLCRAEDGLIYLRSGSELRLRATDRDVSAEAAAFERAHPAPIDRGTAVGRAVVEGGTVHISDVLADPEYRWVEAQRVAGFRTLLAVPIRRADETLGVITFSRHAVSPFSEREIALVETFADQAAIAIENVRLFDEIQETSRQLEIANRHKSEFLANMSHELRTPLNAIIGFSDVLVGGMAGELDAKQHEYLEDIRSSGRHLLALINDILDLSKVEAGRMELTSGEFSLRAALVNAVTMIRERAAGHGIAIDVGLEGVDVISADERKVKQILFNLLSNAVKFTPKGGSITVRAVRQDGDALVSVRDTGTGIPEEARERIFQEFRQSGAASARSAEVEGTGLGLALARSFVELHGGRIWVESEVGRGSTFLFTLPLVPAPSGASAAP